MYLYILCLHFQRSRKDYLCQEDFKALLCVCFLGQENEITHIQTIKLKMTSWMRWHARENAKTSD